MSGTLAEPGRIAPWKLKLVRSILNIYRKLRWLSPVVAQRFDEGRSKKWNVDACLFLIDVRAAVADTIRDHPARHELVNAWAQLVNDDKHIGDAGATLINQVAEEFENRQLDPMHYFRRVRR